MCLFPAGVLIFFLQQHFDSHSNFFLFLQHTPGITFGTDSGSGKIRSTAVGIQSTKGLLGTSTLFPIDL